MRVKNEKKQENAGETSKVGTREENAGDALSDEDCERQYSTFLAFRENRVRRGETHFDSFWKNVQFVAAGALGASFTLLNAVAPTKLADLTLKVSWIFFALAIMLCLLGSYFSALGIKWEIPDLDNAYGKDPYLSKVAYSPRTERARKAAGVFGVLAILAIVLGIVLMAIALFRINWTV